MGLFYTNALSLSSMSPFILTRCVDWLIVILFLDLCIFIQPISEFRNMSGWNRQTHIQGAKLQPELFGGVTAPSHPCFQRLCNAKATQAIHNRVYDSFCVSCVSVCPSVTTVRSTAWQHYARHSSPCILHTILSVYPPHGKLPAPHGQLASKHMNKLLDGPLHTCYSMHSLTIKIDLRKRLETLL